MPEYLAPGVYVEEVDTGAKPIEGVSTTTSGMVGVTERGPEGVATLVTSYPDFVRQFGGLLDNDVYTGSTWYLPHAVDGFFTNGGKRLYVVRVLPAAARVAESTLFDQGDTPDSGALTFTRYTRQLAARAARGDQLLLLDDNTNVPAGASAALLRDGEASEYVQLAGAPAGVITIGAPVAAALWASGSAVEGSADAFATVLGATTLIADVAQGEFLLPVADAAILGGSTSYRIGGVEVQPHADNGAITLSAPLSLNHNLNAPVAAPTIAVDGTARQLTVAAPAGSTQITLDSRSAILDPAPAPPQVHFLRLTNAGGEVEFARIDSVAAPRTPGPDPGVITLESPLQRAYVIGDAVSLLTDTNVDTNPTFLAWDADPNDRAAVLGDSGTYAAGTFVRIEAIGAPNADYSQVTAGTTPVLRVATAPFRESHGPTTPVLGRSAMLRVQGIDRGVWGNMLRVIASAENSRLLRETSPSMPAAATSPNLTLRTTVGIEAGSVLEFFTRTGGVETVVFRQKAASVNGNVVGFDAGGLTQAVPATMLVRTVEFQLTVRLIRRNPFTLEDQTIAEENFRQLSMDSRHSRYAVRVLGPIFVNDVATPRRKDGRTEGESGLIRVQDVLYPNFPTPNAAAEANVAAAIRRAPDLLTFTPPGGQPRAFGMQFTGGDDVIASVNAATYRGDEGTNPPSSRTGIFALKNIDEISIVSVPGQTDQEVQEALINHCELMRYRFAVLDSGTGLPVANVQDQRGLYDSKYAALYYPWLQIDDPFPQNPRVRSLVGIPPSGHVMGIYARSDIERGVHKAPANEVVRGIADLEFKLTKEEQDILNPRNINVIRNFRENNRGIRVWGARTISSDPDWKYVNVRRLFIFVEHSIDNGTQWVVFEPNSEPLWERVRRAVSSFLNQVWRNGALMGKTAEEAYFVKCDRTTMTQNDIDNGRLVVLVGIAPVKPAEFVIFRIGQKAGGSDLEEG